MSPKTSSLHSNDTYASETEYLTYVHPFGTVLISKHYTEPSKSCHLFYRFHEKNRILSSSVTYFVAQVLFRLKHQYYTKCCTYIHTHTDGQTITLLQRHGIYCTRCGDKNTTRFRQERTQLSTKSKYLDLSQLKRAVAGEQVRVVPLHERAQVSERETTGVPYTPTYFEKSLPVLYEIRYTWLFRIPASCQLFGKRLKFASPCIIIRFKEIN